MSANPQVPHSADNEEALLGAVLINPESFYDVTPIIKSSDFYIHRNQWIWKAISEMRVAGIDIDLITVCDALERMNKLSECGGSAYLTRLLTSTASSMNATSYAQIIKRYAVKRKYIALANSIAQAAYDDGKDINELPALIRDQIDTVENYDHQFVHIAAPLSNIYDEIESAEAHPQEVWGLPTGFEKFDKATGGLQTRWLIWLGGEPGVGKTWSLSQVSISMSRKAPGALISMEMSNDSIVRRMVSGLSGLRTKCMRSGIGLPRNWREVFGDVSADIESMPIYISDKTFTTDKLRASLKTLKRDYNIEWFGVDYALLFDDRAENEIVRTEIISRNLKHICNDLDLAGVVLQSVTKSGMDTTENASKSRMRGSGQMIHDADLILFLTKFTPLDEFDQSIREEERDRMVTLWTTKGRDLESLPTEHLIRRDSSPFFDEYDPKKLRAARTNQPITENE